MKSHLPTAPLRLLLLVLVTTSAALSACTKDALEDKRSDEEKITSYLSGNNITTAQRQPSGLYYVTVTTAPTNVRATAGKTVSVLYTGYLLDGSVFDASSRHGNTPFSFTLGTGQVIDGWDEGIALMRKGEKAQLLIPSALGYGSRSAGSIPANSVLRFEVELMDVK